VRVHPRGQGRVLVPEPLLHLEQREPRIKYQRRPGVPQGQPGEPAAIEAASVSCVA
jgi:hypothetical protein